jgi:beta-lactamase superfamily II metal-dependent hydrolase
MGDGLLDVIQPKLLVITDSEFPATRRADPSLRERLDRRRLPVLYTRNAGAVTITLSSQGWEVTAMNGLRLSGAADVRPR